MVRSVCWPWGGVVIALSYSGETKELLALLHFFDDFDVKLITLHEFSDFISSRKS